MGLWFAPYSGVLWESPCAVKLVLNWLTRFYYYRNFTYTFTKIVWSCVVFIKITKLYWNALPGPNSPLKRNPKEAPNKKTTPFTNRTKLFHIFYIDITIFLYAVLNYQLNWIVVNFYTGVGESIVRSVWLCAVWEFVICSNVLNKKVGQRRIMISCCVNVFVSASYLSVDLSCINSSTCKRSTFVVSSFYYF